MIIPKFLLMIVLSTIHIGITNPPHLYTNLNLSARIYAVPPWQGIRVGTLQKSKVSAVNVTTNFPDGIVLVSTDILSLKRDQQIEGKIRQSLSRGGIKLPGKGKIGLLSAKFPIKGQEFKLKNGTLREQIQLIEGNIGGRNINLTFQPLESSKNELIARISFKEERHSSVGGEIYMKLLDRSFGIPFSRVYLIGFPSIKGGRGGTIYWLAILVESHRPALGNF